MSKLISSVEIEHKTLSRQRNTYNLSKIRFLQLKSKGINQCEKCGKNFYENHIGTETSAKKHCCYHCAVKINLVSGNVPKDLCFNEINSETTRQIILLSSNAGIGQNIQKFALLILKDDHYNQNSLSKNPVRLVASAIYIACMLYCYEKYFKSSQRIFLFTKTYKNVNRQEMHLALKRSLN